MGIGDVTLWRGSTLFIAACAGGQSGLANTLADRGSDVYAVTAFNYDALIYACRYGHRVVAAMLLDRGINLEARSINGWTALNWAARNDHTDTCLLLISRGIDLMAVDIGNQTALDLYGRAIYNNTPTHARPALSDEVKEERREILRAAFANGLHPSQVQRRKDERWDRRWPWMSVMVRCDFHPLAARRAEIAKTALPPSASIPPLPTDTKESASRFFKTEYLATRAS